MSFLIFLKPWSVLEISENLQLFLPINILCSEYKPDEQNKEEIVWLEWGSGIMVQVAGGAAFTSICNSSVASSLGCWEVVFLSVQLGSSCFCCVGYNSGSFDTPLPHNFFCIFWCDYESRSYVISHDMFSQIFFFLIFFLL